MYTMQYVETKGPDDEDPQAMGGPVVVPSLEAAIRKSDAQVITKAKTNEPGYEAWIMFPDSHNTDKLWLVERQL